MALMSTSRKIKLVQLKLTDLKPAPYNPRDITDAAFEGLKESIRKFGFVDPLVMNTRTGLLVGGHQRLKAAQALEMETVPVVQVDLSEVEEKALNITLNNHKISGHYTDVLQDLLSEIADDLGEELMAGLKLDDLVLEDGWETDIDRAEKTEESDERAPAVIKIKCPQDLKDEVLVIIKRALLETSLEGVHVE